MFHALLLITAVLGGAVDSLAQPGITIATPHPQFLDFNGKPLSGGLVFVYQAGTSTPAPTYSDSSNTALNSNPIVLDSGGFVSCSGGTGGNQGCGIYLVPAASYRFVVEDKNGVQQWTVDDYWVSPALGITVLGNKQVLYNCFGAICGDSGLLYDFNTGQLQVTSLAVNSGGSLSGSFGGAPVLSGLWNFTAGLQTTFTRSGQSNPATAGFVRMSHADCVAMRDNGNTVDLQLVCSDAQDRLLLGGTAIVGPIQYMFGGTTAAQPMLKASGTSIGARLADDSADADLSGGNIVGSASVTVGAVKVHGVATAGQTLMANSPTDATWQAAPGFKIVAKLEFNPCLPNAGNGYFCTGTANWGTTITGSYNIQCTVAYGAFAAQIDSDGAQFVWITKSSTSFTYSWGTLHSGSNNVGTTVDCVAIQ